MIEEHYYVIYFQDGGDMPYCRVNYDFLNNERKLILNGYSLMANWRDASIFENKEDAIKIILENIDTKRIQKDKLNVLDIKLKGEFVYGHN